MAPTRWQPMHRFSPAPEWQAAQTDGSRQAADPWSFDSPFRPTHPAGCGLRPPEATSTFRRAWQLSQNSLVVWHVEHSPGCVRASSECRETKPAR